MLFLNDYTAMAYHNFLRKELEFLIPSKYSAVLEIGCGTGSFRQFFTSPHSYTGIEPEVKAAQIATSQIDTIFIGTFEDVEMDLQEQQFDLIVCNDVIEHMNDHVEFLNKIKQKMRPGSYLIGSIPNIRFIGSLYELLIKRDWMYREAGILDKTHLRFFTYKSLKRCFEENGYIIEELKGINGPAPKFGFKWIAFYTSVLLMGTDTRSPQYAFRVKLDDR